MFCTQCGTKNSDADKFCSNCGNNLSIKEIQIKKFSSDDDIKPYVSPYEDEETLVSLIGLNRPEKRVFPNDKKDIPLLNNPHCDFFYTTRRVCLTMGDPNVKEPTPTKWFIPLGGGLGMLANSALQGAINGYRKSQFKKKHGALYEPAEIDIMCLAGNAIYSNGAVHVYIFKDKLRFFNTIGNDPKYMNIAFMANYQYQDRLIKGAILHPFSGDVDSTIKQLKKQYSTTVEVSGFHRNDEENMKYLVSKLI